MLIVGKAAKLEKNPEFYNSISVNCTTAFAPMIRQIDPEFPSDIRLIFNGYFDRLLFEAGYLKRRESESFGSLKSRSYIPGKSSGI